MAKTLDPVTKARKAEKQKQKAKNAKARKEARAPRKPEAGSSTAASGSSNVIQILPDQKGGKGAIQMPKGLKGKDPRRSVYYDAVFNPTGAPPPGFEWKERDVSPEEEEDEDDSEDEDSEEDSDGIELPEGPPPDGQDDSDDEIPLPEGPPPPQASTPAPPAAGMPPPPRFHPVGPPPQFVPPPPQFGAPQIPAKRPAPPSREMLERARQSATIQAEPELRDLRKEATGATFVPNAVKRKRVQ